MSLERNIRVERQLIRDHAEARRIVQVRQIASGEEYTVRIVRELPDRYAVHFLNAGDVFCGLHPLHKGEWEIVGQNTWLVPTTIIGGVLVLGAMIGIILDLFFR